MGILSFLPSILGGTKDVVETFKENTEQKGVRKHKESMADIDRDVATLNQFASEFYERKNRTWGDSLADTLNRLIRPVITIAVLSIFVYAPINPDGFVKMAQAYELIPNGYWALLSVIVGFYFGGRMQLKANDMKLSKENMTRFSELTKARKEFRKIDDDDESPQSKIFDTATVDNTKKIQNKVVFKWLEDEEDQGD